MRDDPSTPLCEALDRRLADMASDEELADIVGLVAVNVFTNYFNKTFDVEVDFPRVDPHEHALAA